MLNKNNVKNIYALSPLQEGILFHALYDRGSSAYFQQFSYNISGDLDIGVFEKSWNELMRRHDIFRTVFLFKNVPQPLQLVLKERDMDFYSGDIRDLPEEKQDVYIREFREKDRLRSFDLSKDVLLRVSVLRSGENSFKVIWSFHHILLDGWCMQIIHEELLEVYGALKAGVRPELPPVTPYSHYIRWLERLDRESSRGFWKDYLSGYEHLASLPKKRYAGDRKGYTLEKSSFEFDEDVTSGLHSLASLNRVTLNTVIRILWGILLGRYNNTDDVVFGVTVSGRPPELEGIERMVGLFINTIPVRIKSGDTRTFRELLRKVQGESPAGDRHHHYSLAEIQADSALRQGLLDHILVFENYPLDEGLREKLKRGAGLVIDRIEMFEQTNYDVEVSVFPGNKIGFSISYNSEIYDRAQMRKIEGHLKGIAASVLRGGEAPVKKIDILTHQERRQLLTDFNKTHSYYPEDKTVVDLFEAQARKNPDNIAVNFEGREISYKELNERSNQLAHCLLDNYDIRPDALIGIMVDRSEWMLVGILGILKSGAAYVPIDPEFPQERIDYILENSSCRILLTETKYIKGLHRPSTAGLCDIHSIRDIRRSDPARDLSGDNLAYVIYTSGSTGKPKGVMVTHRNVAGFNLNMQQVFGLGSSDNIYALTTITFDISVLELINSLLTGMKVVISPDAVIREPEAVLRKIREYDISALQVTPSRLKILLEAGGASALRSLRVLLVGGEPLPEDLFARLKPVLATTDIFNVYGPTETTIWSACKRLNDGRLNIGSPLLNESIYILSGDNLLAPVGVPGEICIGGDGVTRGYYRQPELTSEKFVPHPFREGELLYKTGDIGRRLPEGDIECLGRNDDQVKIRGYRIEPGEIESLLKRHPDIEDAVVVAREVDPPTKDLVAYFAGGEALRQSDLRAYLSKTLPGYMIPSYFVPVDKLPLTPNGKIDRKALPCPEAPAPGADRIYVSPGDEVEEKLAKIWEAVLNRGRIGVNEDFFELGGHSLKATRIVSRLHKAFDVEVSLREFFDCPTVGQLSRIIRQKADSRHVHIGKVPDREYYEVSHAQRRLWILDRMEEASIAYNLSSAYMMEGRLELPAFHDAFKALIRRHESLRTTFLSQDGTPLQKVHEDIGFEMEYLDLSRKDNSEEFISEYAAKEAAMPFDLAKGPLMRAKLLRLSDRRHVFLFSMHHIVGDGWSLEVLGKEVAGLYRSSSKGRPVELSPLRIQYRDYAAWQNDLLNGDMIKEHRIYWHNKLSGELPVLNLPYDYPRPDVQTFNGGAVLFTLEKALTEGLLGKGRQGGASLFMTLLAAIKVLFFHYTGQGDIIIGSPVAGRNHYDLEDQIGFFVNTLALRDEVRGTDSFEAVLQKVKQTTIDAYDHQLYPFDMLVDELDLQRDTSRSAVFDVMVVLQEDERADFNSDDLKITPIKVEAGISRFDLAFNFQETTEGLQCIVNYNTDLFKEEKIRRLGDHFRELVKGISEGGHRLIRDMDILTEAERLQLLREFNNTETYCPGDKTIADLFEEQVEKTPGNIAVIFEDRILTYRELNTLSNQLAQYLRDNCLIQPGDLAGVMVERSEWLIIGLLGILKSGGVYLPIDTAYPPDRVKYILKDSRCRVLLTGGIQRSEVGDHLAALKVIDITTAQKEAAANPGRTTSGNDAAYVIYTSGSTGEPKGVMLGHQGFINMSLDQIRAFGVCGTDRVLQFSSPSFDASLSEIFMTFFSGAALVLIDKDTMRDTGSFMRCLDEKGVTVVTLPPVYLRGLDRNGLRAVKTIITAGEPAIVEDAIYYGRTKQYFNAYGPTEASVCVSYHRVDPGYPYQDNIPIGRPISNTSVYILGDALNLLPVGLAGEICISGAGLAKGYLNRPELTEEKFIENPFKEGERLYRTGDMGRRLADGNIEYLGRKDAQVKIRGYRVEPGEVAHHLLLHPDVKDAVVTAKKVNGSNELAAYIVGRGELKVSELRGHLKKTLPDYMIPAYFVSLKELPLTPNGKVDKKALPDPRYSGLGLSAEYALPAKGLEERLLRIWETVLGRQGIGVNDDFFELGGNSIKAIQMTSVMRRELGRETPVMLIFQARTISRLAQYIEDINKFVADYEDTPVMLLNNKKDKNIFCLPPLTGYAVSYKAMAGHLKDHSVYGLNFIGNEGRTLERYVDLIRGVQGEGPYVLLGYSSGGNLSFELSKELMSRGCAISDIILLDSWKRDHSFSLTREEKRHILYHYFEDFLEDVGDGGSSGPFMSSSHIKEQVLRKMKAYLEYVDNTVNSGRTEANIHLIKAAYGQEYEYKGIRHISQDWGGATSGEFKTYSGFGNHTEMLKGTNLKANASIISGILKGIRDRKEIGPEGII